MSYHVGGGRDVSYSLSVMLATNADRSVWAVGAKYNKTLTIWTCVDSAIDHDTVESCQSTIDRDTVVSCQPTMVRTDFDNLVKRLASRRAIMLLIDAHPCHGSRDTESGAYTEAFTTRSPIPAADGGRVQLTFGPRRRPKGVLPWSPLDLGPLNRLRRGLRKLDRDTFVIEDVLDLWQQTMVDDEKLWRRAWKRAGLYDLYHQECDLE
jgi:hypothetical protein